MELFNKFRSTVFYKDDSDLEKQLNELKSIRDKIENKEEIDKDIKLLEYGIAGENEIAFELKNANIGMYVLHDVTFEYDGNKAQIDYLILTRGRFYIVECKNLYGNITVDSNGQFYREYEYNGKKIKEGMYSPYTQAVRHKDVMEKIWMSNNSLFVNLMPEIIYKRLHEKYFFKPIVVLANSKSILNAKYAPKEVKDSIVRADQLIGYIKNDLDKMDSADLSSEKILKKAAEVWSSRSIQNTTNVANKYLKIIETIDSKKELENELREFRKLRSSKMNIPAYYVFTDEELNNILELMPRTIEELKSRKVLPEIKIKCHGEEIIKILNSKE